MAFVIRQFHNDQTLGEKLHTLRKEARLTLSELSAMTKIQKSYLKAFEENVFHKLPDPIYARNYLKTLAHTLGADETYYLDQFEQERGTCDVVSKHQLPRQRTRKATLFVASRFIQICLFVFLIGSLATYIGLQVKRIVTPPHLSISSPTDGYLTSDATIVVKGKTDKGSSVTINGQTVLLAQDGTFEKEIALERGVNVLQIEGAKRYSHLATMYRRVIFNNGNSVGLIPSSDPTHF